MSTPPAIPVTAIRPRGTRLRTIFLVFIPILLVISAAIFMNMWAVASRSREIERVRWLIKLQQLEIEIAPYDEKAALVRKEMALWKDFEPAMDVQRYPIVQLSH